MPRAKTVSTAQSAVAAGENMNNTTSTASEVEAPVKKYKVKKTIDPNTVVTVRNGFNGVLVYISRKTGERFIWEDFGDEQEMDLQELKNAKNSSKAFFANNWFMISDPEIIEYLGVEQYYKDALTYEEFDTLFEMQPDDIENKVNKLSAGQKKSVAYRAKQLIAEGAIDSIKAINSLEKSLGVVLIER